MGYWGYLVVGRAERPLAGLGPLPGAEDGLALRTSAPGGWQLWEYPGETGVGNMNDLAGRTGAPALFGYVMGGACAIVEAAAPESGAWTTCLGRDAMAGYLGVTDGGLTLEDYFLEPSDAGERAAAWAAEAGHAVRAADLTEILAADPARGAGGDAEDLFLRLLDRLGVVPL